MSPGDLVTYYWPSFLSRIADSEVDKGVGIVVEVRIWNDSGAPDRNFGVDVFVQWPSGEYGSYQEDELRLVT